LEVRPPFLDHRICEFALSLPVEFKVRGSRLKFVLRELLKDKLPAAIVRRKKSGFAIPAHDWLRGGLKPLLLDTITEDKVKKTRFLRWDGVQSLLNDHFERRANWGYHLWGLMMLLLWMQKWNVQIPAAIQDQRKSRPGGIGAELIVVVIAAAIFIGTGFGPPHLMDDVDEVQAQVAANMVRSGDWVVRQDSTRNKAARNGSMPDEWCRPIIDVLGSYRAEVIDIKKVAFNSIVSRCREV
jgi:asparagine synthase